MPFKKGESGNPGGRPKDTKYVKMLARKRTEDAIRALTECLDAENDGRVRVAAATALLDRGWGKPVHDTEEAIALAKLAMLQSGTDPDARTVTVVLPDLTRAADNDK